MAISDTIQVLVSFLNATAVTAMPAWSPEIANEIIRIGRDRGQAFNQMQLQKLIYIAHGWTLAYSDQPLTGDRPEAWSFGPAYRRLSDALAHCGQTLVVREIRMDRFHAGEGLIPSEMDTIAMVCEDYGALDSARLSLLTQSPGAPWAQVFAEGKGEFRDIPHNLVRAQFVELAEEATSKKSS